MYELTILGEWVLIALSASAGIAGMSPVGSLYVHKEASITRDQVGSLCVRKETSIPRDQVGSHCVDEEPS
jgi:hypothetical protein